MTDSAAAAVTEAAEPEHRASWLELFFDLVVVVAIATLTERLQVDADGWALARGRDHVSGHLAGLDLVSCCTPTSPPTRPIAGRC